jgi:Protein of unknown function (DUF3106)
MWRLRNISAAAAAAALALSASPAFSQQRHTAHEKHSAQQPPPKAFQPKSFQPQSSAPSQQPNMKSQFVPHPLQGPGPHAGDWLRRFRGVPPAEQQKMLESDPEFSKLPPDRQSRLRDRLQWFNSRTPEEQQRILDRMEVREHMTPEQKQEEKQLFQRFRGLPDDRRDTLRLELRNLSVMAPDDRQRYMGSDEFRTKFSDSERDMLNEAVNLGTPKAKPAVPRPPQ